MAVATVALPDGRTVHLGRIRPKVRPQVLPFAAYFDAAKMTAPPPAEVDYLSKAAPSIRHMYMNDREGDCVIASAFHQAGIWSANDSDSGGVILGTEAEAHSQYQSICGPGDNGCDIAAVLNYTKSHGLILGGKPYKIDGYVSVDWRNKLEVQVALYLFGSLKLGINLPQAWADAPDGGLWDVTNTRIVGGHDVPAGKFSAQGVTIATWAATRIITWPAFTSTKWIEECYAVLSPQWYGSDKLAPSGVNADKLKADLALLGGGTIPPIDPTPVPPDPPPTPIPTPPPVGTIAAVNQARDELLPQLVPNSQQRADVVLTFGYLSAWLNAHGYK